ncbi:MAG: NUDIX hydrolase [Planctomycetes bacterium]|nr:NUDIX hydrolase [Planctomycetota bacterium]
MSALSGERVLQAAAIPYRWNGGRLEIALITRRTGDSWIVPKGHVEAGETPRQSARREATEEAGLLGKMGIRPLGSYEYSKGREPHFVLVFLLLVTRELRSWSEDDVREREWIRIERAIKRVRERGLRQLLRALDERLSA